MQGHDEEARRVGAPKAYADTSVFGGAFEAEFEWGSVTFLEQARQGRFELMVSALVEEEIADAPQEVWELFGSVASAGNVLPITQEALDLQEAYMRAGIVGPARRGDALHVATASVSGCVFIVSWNFKHIVHYGKIPLYNATNSAMGYRPIGIFSPLEVIAYEEDDS